MVPKFYHNKSESGEWKPEWPEQRAAYLKGLKPGRYVETIKKYVPNRSDRQNRYYFGVVVKMICDETGSDKDTVHLELKKKFLLIKDGAFPVVGSTKKLTTKEFMEYINECVLWVAEFLGISIPPPDYVDY